MGRKATRRDRILLCGARWRQVIEAIHKYAVAESLRVSDVAGICLESYLCAQHLAEWSMWVPPEGHRSAADAMRRALLTGSPQIGANGLACPSRVRLTQTPQAPAEPGLPTPALAAE